MRGGEGIAIDGPAGRLPELCLCFCLCSTRLLNAHLSVEKIIIRKPGGIRAMDLKHVIELIHISAKHASSELRAKAIAEYIRYHPEINRDEVLAMIPDTHIG
jgi:hypothetical protein